MELLIPFALKSLLIAGVTLGLLHLLRNRSASERSMVAHFGLLALLIMPLGSMLLPQLVIEAPLPEVAAADPLPVSTAEQAPGIDAAPPVTPESGTSLDPLSLWPLFYGFPAAVLLAVTLLAVLRLLALRAKATVLVEPSWLSALAHAQRRMNFKHGTALLSSSELRSPISWGVLRPVILLNEEALKAGHEAEAIIAHELAHVRGLDWAKLLMARVVNAIFWFNPLVWILVREAHQLREETADDAVLAADVASTDYAQLLVGVARHDCKGLLLGAHGVAPGKGSLSRRVRRVLDVSLPRTPVARGFAAGMALGVIGTAAPLAALTFTPGSAVDPSEPYYVSPPEPARSLPSVVAESVAEATALTGEAVSAKVAAALTGAPATAPEFERKLEQQIEARVALAAAHPHEDRPSASTRRPDERLSRAVDRAITMKAVGVTPDYAAQVRAAAPGLRISDNDLVSLRAVGVSPEWLRAMTKAGYRPRDVDDLVGARAVGVGPSYVADLASAGYRNVPLDELTSMRAVGVTGTYIRRLRSQGVTELDVDKLIELRALGVSRVRSPGPPPAQPVPPTPPGHGDPHWDDPPELPEEPHGDHDPDHGE